MTPLPKQITDDEYRTRFYEDLVAGEKFVSHWATVSEAEILQFAADYDRQYFHADAEAAKASPFGGVIASGAHTFAVWNRLNLETNGDIAWIAGVGFEDFRFPNALRADVEFQVRSELLTSRVSKSDPSRGIVTHRYSMWTRENDCLFTAECIALVTVGPSAPFPLQCPQRALLTGGVILESGTRLRHAPESQ